MNIHKNIHGSSTILKPTQEINLKILALDLGSCTRCVGTLNNIEAAINKVKNILDVTNTSIHVNKILIESEEEAKAHRFVSSPTIRINDHDIVYETLESECNSCTELCECKDGISCRVWKYQGKEYIKAPVGLIVESLMAEIYTGHEETAREIETYQEVPQNLKRFFANKTEKEVIEVSACCSTEKQETCCEPSEKEVCCQIEESETCGCP